MSLCRQDSSGGCHKPATPKLLVEISTGPYKPINQFHWGAYGLPSGFVQQYGPLYPSFTFLDVNLRTYGVPKSHPETLVDTFEVRPSPSLPRVCIARLRRGSNKSRKPNCFDSTY